MIKQNIVFIENLYHYHWIGTILAVAGVMLMRAIAFAQFTDNLMVWYLK